MSRHIVLALALAFEVAPPSARAYFDPPSITPASPRTTDAVSVKIHGGICDGIIELPGYPQITRGGNAIRVLEYGVHEDFQDWCIYPEGTYSVPLGTLSEGNYSLTVDFAYDDYPFGIRTVNLGAISFSVTAAAPNTGVPALTASGLFALVVLMGCLGIRGLRARSS